MTPRRLLQTLAVWITLTFLSMNATASLPPAARARLAAGTALDVVVEFNGARVDAAARADRQQRRLPHDDEAIRVARVRAYADLKDGLRATLPTAQAVLLRDFDHLPIALWRIQTVDALARLESHATVLRIHENRRYYARSVSDLAVINQPQTASLGALGTGASIAVIDGGLGSNYSYADFGACTSPGTAGTGCRVVVNARSVSCTQNPQASTETAHGTNVAAIALGVAPGATLQMYDVFSGSSATTCDILNAMNSILRNRSSYNTVTLNLSLGDGGTNPSQCGGSAFASAISQLSQAGVTTVVAAGNSTSKTGLGDPACVPGVVSVGAVYDQTRGGLTYPGLCTDANALADAVACFSQSASYLSLLAPGTFVSAPDSSSAFTLTGTSQAAPHVAGAIAVLRARYPSESTAQTLKRLQLGGVPRTDAVSGVTTPRLDLYAATTLGTSLTLTGTGPASSIAGGTGVYSLSVTNAGPLTVTNGRVTLALPANAQFVSGTAGCTSSGTSVVCSVASLAVNGSLSVTITLSFTATGSVTTSASVTADQSSTAPLAARTITLGAALPPAVGDAPLPPWAWVLTALLLFTIGRARLAGRRGGWRPGR